MKKSLVYYLLIFLSLCSMTFFFPIAGIDISWSLKNITDFSGVLNITSTNLIASTLVTVFIKYKILKIAAMSLFGTLLFAIISTTINKKNDALILIAFFLFFLLDRSTLAVTFTSIHGFASIMVGIIGLLILVKLIIKDYIQKINPIVLCILGITLSGLELPFAFTALIITVAYTFKRIEDGKRVFSLLIPELIGTIYSITRMNFFCEKVLSHLIHDFIPTICGQNFILILVLSALVLVLSIKVFTEGHKLSATLSILGIGAFLFSSLLSNNDYLNYITYVIYNASSIYILQNITRSTVFKRKISIYYTFEIVYIVALAICGNIDTGKVLFPFIIDMILILEIYDQILPNDFLMPLWIGCTSIMSIVNIYTYWGVYNRYVEMNFFIKNKLECTSEDIVLPNKYNMDYIADYIPKGLSQIQEYIDYYKIDVYDKDKKIEINFRKAVK